MLWGARIVLRARLSTAAIAIPLLLALIWYGSSWAFITFVAAIGVLGISEHASMVYPERRRERWGTLIAGGALVSAVVSGSATVVLLALLALVFFGFSWVLFMSADFREDFPSFGVALAGLLFVGLFLPHFALLHQLPADGRAWTIFVIAVGMGGDSAGYFIGRKFGRTKLHPTVSPGKTIEGAYGIFAGSLAVGLLGKLFLLPDLGWIEVVVLATIMAVLGQIGDLSESMLKRTSGTKESGSLFPGHGGVLDRIDSLLFPVVFVYYYLVLVGA